MIVPAAWGAGTQLVRAGGAGAGGLVCVETFKHGADFKARRRARTVL